VARITWAIDESRVVSDRSLAHTRGRDGLGGGQIRVKDPEKSLQFYRDVMGLTLVDKYDFEQFAFSLYFLQSLPADEVYTLTPGSPEAHKYLWSTPGVTLELTHNW
jgi:hypothetical protein